MENFSTVTFRDVLELCEGGVVFTLNGEIHHFPRKSEEWTLSVEIQFPGFDGEISSRKVFENREQAVLYAEAVFATLFRTANLSMGEFIRIKNKNPVWQI